jgi:hypothetical protein
MDRLARDDRRPIRGAADRGEFDPSLIEEILRKSGSRKTNILFVADGGITLQGVLLNVAVDPTAVQSK